MSFEKIKPTNFDLFATVFYPSSCFCCRTDTNMCVYVCDQCAEKLNKLKTKRTKTVSYYGNSFTIHSVFYYKDEASAAVKMLKFTFSPDGAKAMGDYIAEKASRLKTQDFDLVAAVPMTVKRVVSRGYNQAELIGKQVSRYYKIPFNRKCIKKIRETKPQHTLSGIERRINIRNAYAATADVKGKHILLVDDVATTGATLCECATTLLNAGARRVTLMTFAATKYSN